MKHLVRRTLLYARDGAESDSLLTREWLVTNGLGGYASGSIAGIVTRRYHGFLIAAMPAPLGRLVMLSHLAEEVEIGGQTVELSGEELHGEVPRLHMAEYLAEFELIDGLPLWRYRIGSTVLERCVLMPYRQNTTHISFRLREAEGPVRLRLRPSVKFRPHEAAVNVPIDQPYRLTAIGDRFEIADGEVPPLRLRLTGAPGTLTVQPRTNHNMSYRLEQNRGYESSGDLWSPGFFAASLVPGQAVTLVASVEPWDTIDVLSPEEAVAAERQRREQLLLQADQRARQGLPAELVLAADQFIITDAGRVDDTARAHASGDEARTVIAGYHWFTDWGRDTMISLEGLTLATGRPADARYILRTFAHHMRNGLIPNLFPEGEETGLYHTADATMWFFHALDRYVTETGDRSTLALLLPRLQESIEHHLRGTDFGIRMDPGDALLRQGEPGYALTWMDAKVGDWVVTPRRGKAVEINALWYNALRLTERWVCEEQGPEAAEKYAELAERARSSFNTRFWYDEGGYLYDVVDGEEGDDRCCRPNQILAVSLPHPVLDEARWTAVVDTVERRLLTPVGLRSLAPGEPAYKPQYDGDLRARDAAYHQGTTWAWLIGPFVDAWLKVHRDQAAEARTFLSGFDAAITQACVGSIAEIFDADPPFTPRGCIAQAWSVAEVLRVWLKTHA